MKEQTIQPEKTIRLDKWLKIARIYKTRSLAARACEEGKVKVNSAKAKPSRMIKIGDQITIKVKHKYRTLDVVDIVHKSISNKDAKMLYHEHTPQLSEGSKELFQLLQEWDRQGKRKYKGRPTKKERRALQKLRGY